MLEPGAPDLIRLSGGRLLAHIDYIDLLQTQSDAVGAAALAQVSARVGAAEADVLRIQIWVAVVVALSALLIGLLLWTTLRPLRRLTRQAEQISAGEWALSPVPLSGARDVRALAITMNEMLSTLPASNSRSAMSRTVWRRARASRRCQMRSVGTAPIDRSSHRHDGAAACERTVGLRDRRTGCGCRLDHRRLRRDLFGERCEHRTDSTVWPFSNTWNARRSSKCARSEMSRAITPIRSGVPNNELILHLQQIVDLHIDRLAGAEALMRW